MLDDLLFTLNAVAPIIAMVLIGYVLKRLKFITPFGAKEMNKLVFKLFLPALLFFNVYNIKSFESVNFRYILFVCVIVLLIFGLGIVAAVLTTDNKKRRGAIAQAAFRSNYALIGIPLATSVFGDEGSAYATLLSAFSIPLFNVLAVIILSVFGGGEKRKVNVKKIILGIVKNPLIDAIALGVVALLVRGAFVKYGVSFRLLDITPLYKVLSQVSAVATPLALIVLGANFEFSAIPGMKREIAVGVIMRCVVAPIVGLSIAYLLGGFSGAEFAVFVSVFGTSVAVSSAPMAQEMDSDATLAGQLVVWTTVISAFTLFVFIYLLRVIGIF
ncbi:MAG: AEC family transporter [Clostridia bacterium]|nr:AEC family transporter [Clostridia bacterium]